MPRKKAAAGVGAEASEVETSEVEASALAEEGDADADEELQPEAKAIEAVDARRAVMAKSERTFEWFIQS